jgi:hypothetical protein
MPTYPYATLWQSARDAVAARVAALPLEEGRGGDPGPATRVVQSIAEVTHNVVFPCVLVTQESGTPSIDFWDTGSDEVKLPVCVALLDRRDRLDAAEAEKLLGWFATLMTAFFARPLSGLTECWRVDVRTLAAPDARAALGPAYMHARGAWLLECRCIVDRITY